MPRHVRAPVDALPGCEGREAGVCPLQLSRRLGKDKLSLSSRIICDTNGRRQRWCPGFSRLRRATRSPPPEGGTPTRRRVAKDSGLSFAGAICGRCYHLRPGLSSSMRLMTSGFHFGCGSHRPPLDGHCGGGGRWGRSQGRGQNDFVGAQNGFDRTQSGFDLAQNGFVKGRFCGLPGKYAVFCHGGVGSGARFPKAREYDAFLRQRRKMHERTRKGKATIPASVHSVHSVVRQLCVFAAWREALRFFTSPPLHDEESGGE